ncbi:MAG TPA: flagellar basal body P-ring formation chaperone FlgA [Candidatus Deferrimicrobium sp.]
MMDARGDRHTAPEGALFGAARSFLVLSAAVLAVYAPSAVHAGGPAPAEILRTYVLEHRPWADVEVRNLALSTDPPAGSPRRIVVERGLPGRTVFAMEYGNGITVKATADVAAFEEVVASARPLSKERPLKEGDVCLVRMELENIPTGTVTDLQAVVGKTLTRSIGANLPIVDRYLAGSPLVKRGGKVTLLVETGGIRITTTGEIRDNAYVHTSVRAVNLASRKTVTGILIDENTVRVDY